MPRITPSRMCRLRAISSASPAGRRAGSDRPEAERIEDGDRPRAHGENVAQDSADTGGRALKRLDEARMIVRFDFEDGDQAVADVDDAGVFARSLHDVGAASSGGASDERGWIYRSSARSTSR